MIDLIHTDVMESTFYQFKKEGKDNDVNGSNSNSASRGNWWKGMTTSMNLLLDKEEMMVLTNSFNLALCLFRFSLLLTLPSYGISHL